MARTSWIKIRATEDEKNEWTQKADAAGLPLSDLIRQAISRTRTWTAEERKAEQERIRKLAQIGNNLTQIARWCNQHKSAADALQIIKHLLIIEGQLNDKGNGDAH